MSRSPSSRVMRRLKVIPLLLVIFAAVAAGVEPSQPWSFAVVGDSRNHPEIFCKLITMIKDDPSHPVLLLHTGDMVGAADASRQWSDYHRCLDILGHGFPVYPAIGNHELKGVPYEKAVEIYKEEARPYDNRLYYAFKYQNAGFISLDTEEPGHVKSISPRQMKWLERGLSKLSPEIEYVFVFLHRPLWPQGVYRDQPMKNRAELHALFKKYRVSAVFQGHEHMYSHIEKDGVHYITCAGGGAPLYKGYGGEFYHYVRVVVGPSEAVATAVDVYGNARDEVTIPKR